MGYTDTHIPVMRKEVMHYLNLKKGDLIFEGTLGGAGHTVEIIKAIAPTGRVIGVDLDSQAISTAARNLEAKGLLKFITIVNDNFSNIKNILRENSLQFINGFLLDLGLSSMQISESGRGFSYLKNEKLDMRFKGETGIKASEILNEYSEGQLSNIFYKYGEEKWSGRIAKNIVIYRSSRKLELTGELIEIIKKSIPLKYQHRQGGHPAKRVFQAIRIEVNRELENLSNALRDGVDVLTKGGRMVVISYHSLEDRIVKDMFTSFTGMCTCPPDFPECRCNPVRKGKIITRKIITPSDSELLENPRSKSAKMRVFEKD
ncbi:MAG: Ribosomal RNA small subunit methyltransferase H [Actinobacteria bacterium ADurb.Bin346]|nr:MAG: Ribosomal RNA small subunit methyltransferase H [Actinobacteria bacterium ADurb.Bin346]